MLSYKLILVLVVALACPAPLFAQQDGSRPSLKLPTAVFAAAASADWATTYHGLKHYRLRETNPLIRRFDRTPAKMVLIGGAIDIGALALWNHTVGRRHPRVAAAGLWAMTAFRAYLAIHNIRNQEKAGRR
jgi:hypothetical protein